jgi:hypothetical protein
LRNDGEFVARCRYRRSQYRNNRIESDHRHVKRRWRAMQDACTIATARVLIQGIDRSNTDDQKRPSPWDRSAQSPRTGLGLRSTPRRGLTPSSAIRSRLNLQHFHPRC